MSEKLKLICREAVSLPLTSGLAGLIIGLAVREDKLDKDLTFRFRRTLTAMTEAGLAVIGKRTMLTDDEAFRASLNRLERGGVRLGHLLRLADVMRFRQSVGSPRNVLVMEGIRERGGTATAAEIHELAGGSESVGINQVNNLRYRGYITVGEDRRTYRLTKTGEATLDELNRIIAKEDESCEEN